MKAAYSGHIFFNMPGTKRAVLYMLAVFVFYLWYQAFFNLLYIGRIFDYNGLADLMSGFLFGYFPLLAMSTINTLVVFLIDRGVKSPLKILVDLLLSQSAPIAVNMIFIGFGLLMGKNPEVEWIQSVIINFMIFSIHEIIYFLYNHKKSERMYERERRVSAQLKYNVLRSQVNPHFLFNSLNILYSLIHIDVPKSGEFILSLSRMYRYIMSKGDSDMVTLREELEFLDAYVEVLRMLYYDSFKVEITDRNISYDCRIYPYSLQLLVENIIKHNVISKENPMVVTITIDDNTITVANNMMPKNGSVKSDDSVGIGLRYLRELYALSGHDCIVSNSDNIFSVTVPLLCPDGNRGIK